MNAGRQLGWSPTSVRLGAWTTDVVRVLAKEDLAKLQEGVEQSIDMAAQAYDLLNTTKAQIDELAVRKSDVQRTFGPMPNDAAAIASAPLIEAENALRTNIRGVAALDVLFYELALAFSAIGNSMQSAGMTLEATRIRIAAQTMRDWRSDAARELYSKMDVALDDRAAIERDFKERLGARRLRHIMDSDKPGYFDALGEAVSRATGVAIEGAQIGMSGSRIGISGHYLGAAPAAIYLLIKAVIVCTTILVVLFTVRGDIYRLFGASEKAKNIAGEYQETVRIREEAIANKEMTRAEADKLNARDLEAAKEMAKQAPPVSPFENILYGTLAAGGALLLLRIFKVI